MPKRLNYYKVAPAVYQRLIELGAESRKSSLEPALLELVKVHASQINGCAYCLDMHTKDARVAGESEQRLYLTSVWREAPQLYSERELAALEWTEALTLMAETHAPDEVYERVSTHFSPEEIIYLTLAIVSINSWNRFAVAFRFPDPGSYRPKEKASHS